MTLEPTLVFGVQSHEPHYVRYEIELHAEGLVDLRVVRHDDGDSLTIPLVVLAQLVDRAKEEQA